MTLDGNSMCSFCRNPGGVTKTALVPTKVTSLSVSRPSPQIKWLFNVEVQNYAIWKIILCAKLSKLTTTSRQPKLIGSPIFKYIWLETHTFPLFQWIFHPTNQNRKQWWEGVIKRKPHSSWCHKPHRSRCQWSDVRCWSWPSWIRTRGHFWSHSQSPSCTPLCSQHPYHLK